MDTDHRGHTSRIAKNTVLLYGRMLIGMLVSLYTSRAILNALGVEDFGIQNVVGGFVAMFSLISSALSSSISRFMTFELGTGDMIRLRKVFSTSLLIQLALISIVLVVAETVGVWFVNNKMVIPSGRLFAANCVFQASVVSFVLGLFSTPYNACIIAHERMNVFALFGILQICINLGIVLFIVYAPFGFDRLIVYSILLTGTYLFMQILYFRYCHKHFTESRCMPRFYRDCWKEMSGFAGWNAIGCTAGILKDQGVNVLLNLFFGPGVNASRGLAGSVSAAVGAFVANFMTAINPQITKSYACEDRQYMFSLVERGSRFGFYTMMLFAVPIILETPAVLSLWLGAYPGITVIFVRLALLNSLLEVLSNTLITLQAATGKIRNYQIAVGGLLLMNFPVSYLALKAGASPMSVYVIAFEIGVGCLLLRLWFLRNMTGLSIGSYLNGVVLNVILTCACAVILPVMIHFLLPEGPVRFISVIISSIVCGVLSILYVGCMASERCFILGKISNQITRLKTVLVL